MPLEPAEAPRGGSHYISGAYCSRTEVLTQDHGSPPVTPAYVRRQTFRSRRDSTITGIREWPLTLPAVNLDTPSSRPRGEITMTTGTEALVRRAYHFAEGAVLD